MYFSERRKQGLGSLRPGYFLGGGIDIGRMLLGNVINYAAPKVYDYATKTPQQREDEKLAKDFRRFGIQPYIPGDYSRGNNEEEEDEGKKSSTFKGALGRGLMSLLATAFLGPIMGPLALTVTRGVMNKSKGLGFRGSDSGGDNIGPGPKGKKTDYYTGSDEEDKDEENRITTPTTSVPTHIGPTGRDIHGDSGGDSGGGSDGWSGGAETQDSSGWESSPFFKGGRVSYSKGGLTSLWQR
jgi:hypothetical protein